MKTRISLLALTAVITAVPSHAQNSEKPVEGAATQSPVDVARDVVTEVAEAAADGKERKAIRAPIKTVQIPPPVPPASFGKGPREPRPKSYGLVRQVDYPIESWNADEEGSVRFSVDVTAEGKPSNCKVVKGSGFARLDNATCPLVMKRMEFHPALDDERNAIAGTHSGRASWRKREPQFPGTFVLKAQYTIDENGEIQNCRLVESSGQLSEDWKRDIEREPCPTNGRGIPYRDANGVPVARDITVRYEVLVSEPAE